MYPSGTSIIFRPIGEVTTKWIYLIQHAWQNQPSCHPHIQYSGHAHETCVARVSPDGSLVASADVWGCLQIWTNPLGSDQKEMRLLGEWNRTSGVFPILDLAWASPKLLYIAGGGSGNPTIRALQLDPVAEGRLVYGESLVGPAKPITTLAVAPLEKPPLVFAGSDDGAVYVGAKELAPIKAHGGFVVQTIAASPTGHLVASGGSDGKVISRTRGFHHLFDWLW